VKQTYRHNPEGAFRQLLNATGETDKKPASITKIIYNAKVVDIDDPKNSRRIKVKISGMDDNTPVAELPWCISIMPTFFYVLPMINEHVLIFLQNPWNVQQGRYWIGPIMSGDETDGQSFGDSVNGLGLTRPKGE